MSAGARLLPLIEEVGVPVVEAMLHAVQAGNEQRLLAVARVAMAASLARQTVVETAERLREPAVPAPAPKPQAPKVKGR